jgi:hypothetical protein
MIPVAVNTGDPVIGKAGVKVSPSSQDAFLKGRIQGFQFSPPLFSSGQGGNRNKYEKTQSNF